MKVPHALNTFVSFMILHLCMCVLWESYLSVTLPLNLSQCGQIPHKFGAQCAICALKGVIDRMSPIPQSHVTCLEAAQVLKSCHQRLDVREGFPQTQRFPSQYIPSDCHSSNVLCMVCVCLNSTYIESCLLNLLQFWGKFIEQLLLIAWI